MTYIALFRVSFCDSFLYTLMNTEICLFPSTQYSSCILMHFIYKLWCKFIEYVFQTVLQVSYFRHDKLLDLDYVRWPWVNLFGEHADARSKNRHYIIKHHGISSKQCCWLVCVPFAISLSKLVQVNRWWCISFGYKSIHHNESRIYVLSRGNRTFAISWSIWNRFLWNQLVKTTTADISAASAVILTVNNWKCHLFTKMVKRNLSLKQ